MQHQGRAAKLSYRGLWARPRSMRPCGLAAGHGWGTPGDFPPDSLLGISQDSGLTGMSISSDCPSGMHIDDSERRQPPADPFAFRRRAVACCAVAESRVEWAPRCYWTGIRYPAQQPLHVAAACGQVDTIESLLRQARPSVPSPGTELSHPRRRRCHASRTVMPHAGVCVAGLVCRCARTRWIGTVVTGLLGGAQARGRSATGAVSAPVAWCFACGGCLEARRMAACSGADVLIQDRGGCTGLHFARAPDRWRLPMGIC